MSKIEKLNTEIDLLKKSIEDLYKKIKEIDAELHPKYFGQGE